MSLKKQIGMCLLAMVVLAVLGFVWSDAWLVTVVFIVLSLMRLSGALYIWWTARRIDKLLEHVGVDETANEKTETEKRNGTRV
jgi:uncharacterized membrane protein